MNCWQCANECVATTGYHIMLGMISPSFFFNTHSLCMSWTNKRKWVQNRWLGWFVGKLKQLSSLPWEVGELRNYSALHFVIVPFPLTCICHLTCSTNFSKTLGGQVVTFQQPVLQFQALLQKYILPSYITWFRKCLTSWWYTWYSLLPDCGTLEYAFVHNNSIRASSLLQIYLLRMPYLNLWFQWSHNQLGKHTAELY